MKSACDILIFGSMGDIAPLVAECLRGHGLKVDEMPFPQETLRDEAGYRRELRKKLEGCAPRVIMPVGCQIAAARCRDIIPSGTILAAEDAGKIELLDSKTSCSRLAAGLGIPQPRIYSNADEVEHYPVIFKKDGSFGGRGVRKPACREALDNIIAHESTPYLIEEYVEGEDYSIDVLRCDGSMRYGCYRSLASTGLGPSSSRQMLDNDDPLSQEMVLHAEAILNEIGYQGICGMDFRLDARTGRLLFLEANPRFTGGLASQIDAGFELPFMLWKVCQDSPDTFSRCPSSKGL